MSGGPPVNPGLRRALVDRTSVPRPNGPEAYSSAMFRALVLAKVARLLVEGGVEGLLVKGAALGLTVYSEPAARLMSDIDLLVRPGENDRVIAALVAGGCDVRPEPGRHHSAALMGETGVFVRAGAMSELVEVHTTLDKVVSRPIPIADLFARAKPAPGLPGLLVPDDVDHALLIALHAASHDFAHTVAFLDLELLLRRGLDTRVLVERARAWRLTAVMFTMLSAMRQLGCASVDDALVAAFDPGLVRRALLREKAARGVSRPGLGWIVSQTALRDDPREWVVGVGRYAVARVRDRTRGAPQESAAPPTTRNPMPLWVRSVVALDRAAARLDNVRAGLRDEALLAWIPHEERLRVTSAIYAQQATYLPGGIRFDNGLFDWEERVLASPHFPKSGRVLLGAAGGGREMVALVQRGFDVVAFDPCGPLVDGARGVARGGGARVLQASYGDLVDAVAGRGGPLAEVANGAPFDAVILGWGSLSHVNPSAARGELFHALRTLAPTAPVLTSFAVSSDPTSPSAGKGRVHQRLRRLFRALGAPGVAEDGDHFFSHLGFFTYLSGPEIHDLARRSGYKVALFEDVPYGYALLQPAPRAHPAER